MDARARGLTGLAPDHQTAQARILVGPVCGGWCVTCDCDETLMFLSGGGAERQARSLARCLSSLGRDTVVEIHDLRGGLVGSILYASETR